MKNGSSGYGMLVIGIVAALAVSIACACIIRSDRVSRDAYAQDRSIGYVQTAADLVAAGKGDLLELMSFYGPCCVSDGSGGAVIRFDGQMHPVEDTDSAAYLVQVSAPTRNGFLGTSTVTFARADGSRIWGVTASWQEGEAQ